MDVTITIPDFWYHLYLNKTAQLFHLIIENLLSIQFISHIPFDYRVPGVYNHRPYRTFMHVWTLRSAFVVFLIY